MWNLSFYIILVYMQQIVCKNFNVYYVSWINNPPYYIKGHPRIGMVPQTIKYHFPSYITNEEKDKFRYNYIDDPKYHLETEKQLIDLLKETNKTRLLQRLNTTENSSDVFIAISTTKKTHGLFSPVPIIQREKVALIMRTADLFLLNQFFKGIWNCKSIVYLAIATAVNLAAVIWLLEMRTNSAFHQSFGAGLWTSFWYCCVTMTTVGYGDKVPKHFLSRCICLCWMFFGVMLVAIITASVMESVQGESSKTDMKIGISQSRIEDSFTRMELSAYPTTFNTPQQIMDAVRSKKMDAGLLDSNFAAYVMKSQNIEDLKIESVKTIHKTVWAHVYQNNHATNLTFDFNNGLVPSETVLRIQTLFVPRMEVSHYYTRSFKRLFDREDGGLVFYMSIVAGCLVTLAFIFEFTKKYREFREEGNGKSMINKDGATSRCNWCFPETKSQQEERHLTRGPELEEERL